MATTSPDNIWTPDAGDDYALTTDLAAMADTIQTALVTHKTLQATSSVTPSADFDWRINRLTSVGNIVVLEAYIARGADITQSQVAGVVPPLFRSNATESLLSANVHFTSTYGVALSGVQITPSGEVKLNLNAHPGIRYAAINMSWRKPS